MSDQPAIEYGGELIFADLPYRSAIIKRGSDLSSVLDSNSQIAVIKDFYGSETGKSRIPITNGDINAINSSFRVVASTSDEAVTGILGADAFGGTSTGLQAIIFQNTVSGEYHLTVAGVSPLAELSKTYLVNSNYGVRVDWSEDLLSFIQIATGLERSDGFSIPTQTIQFSNSYTHSGAYSAVVGADIFNQVYGQGSIFGNVIGFQGLGVNPNVNITNEGVGFSPLNAIGVTKPIGIQLFGEGALVDVPNDWILALNSIGLYVNDPNFNQNYLNVSLGEDLVSQDLPYTYQFGRQVKFESVNSGTPGLSPVNDHYLISIYNEFQQNPAQRPVSVPGDVTKFIEKISYENPGQLSAVPASIPVPIYDSFGALIGFEKLILTGELAGEIEEKIFLTYARDENGKIIEVNGQRLPLARITETNSLTVTETFAQDGEDQGKEVIDVDIKLESSPFAFDFSDVGATIGRQLGYRIAGNDVVLSVGASAVLATLGDNLGTVLDGVVGGKSASYSLEKAFSAFDDELLTNLKSAGIGAISSYLTAELVNVVGVNGFAGEALNTGAGVIIGEIVTNIASNVPNPLAGVGSTASIANAAASFLGTKLASEIYSYETVGGQIGSAVGTTLFAIDAAAFLAYAGVNPITFALAVAWVAIGNLLGGLIGSIFGGTPRAGADATWDEAEGRFVVANAYSRKGGSKDTAIALADTAANTFNLVLEATGSRLDNPANITTGNYGMRKSDFVYRPTSTRDKRAISYRISSKQDGAFERITSYGIFQGLTDPDFELVGGSTYVKRAVYASVETGGVNATNFDSSTLLGNIASAQAYESYLANSAVINAIVSAESDSVFAAETAINLARAVELGLTKRHRADWFGGFGALLDEAGTNVANVEFGFDYDPFSDQISRLIGVGDFVLGDTIDIAGQTTIEGTAGNDTIMLSHVAVNTDGFEVAGGAGYILDTTGLTIDGVLSTGGDLSIDVAATIDAGEGDDVVHAGDLGNNVFGGAGNDTLYGGKLDDWLLGGDGDDVLNAGGVGSYTIGGEGNYLNGGAGNDLLIGREGSDWLEGGDGTDTLEGGDGGDILAGGAGEGDILRGGRGDDQYLFRIGDVGSGGIDDDLYVTADKIIDESGLTVEAVVAQSRTDLNAAQITSYLEDGELFTLHGGLGNWAGGGVQVTANGRAAGGEDVLVLGQGIGIDDIRLIRPEGSNDLVVEIVPDGVFNGDRVVMKDWFSSFNKVETLRFADGNEIRLADFDTFTLGTDGDDTIVGTAGNDFVHAGSGDDLVYLLSGNDFGNGGLGDDSVSGDSGDDIVVGSAGNDLLFGGFGNDMVSGGTGDDILTGDEGDDILSGGTGNDEIIGGTGNDVFRFQRGDGHDTLIDALTDEWEVVWISGQGAQSGYTIGEDGSITHDTDGVIFDGEDWLSRTRYVIETGTLYRHAPNNADAVVISGGTDILEFGLGIDINDIQFATANDGKDLVIGIESSGATVNNFASLNDTITLKEWGPSGNANAAGSIESFVFFNTGAVDVSETKLHSGTDGDDALTGTTDEENWITGGAGDDVLTGAGENDILNGNSGQDRLVGLAGSDVLLGGAGNDVLIGGVGGMRNGQPSGDILIGGLGFDTASYETATSGVTVSLAQDVSATGDATGDLFDSIENLTGSDFADMLAGDAGDNDLTGGEGNDTLKGASGDDSYIFGRGDGQDIVDDQLVASEELIVDSNGDLQPPYVAGFDLVDSESGSFQYDHTVTNAETGEVIYRMQSASTGYLDAEGFFQPQMPTSFDPAGWIPGRFTVSGNQVTEAASFADGGDDTLVFEDYTRDAGFAGDGTIGLADLEFAFSGNDLVITLKGTTDSVTLKEFRSGATINADRAIETIQFSDGSSFDLSALKFDAAGNLLTSVTDTVENPDDSLLVGTALGDTLTGGFGDDTLSGLDGNDTLNGGDGDDLLSGGLGADSMDGGAGTDTVSYVSSDAAIDIDLGSAAAATSIAGSESSGDTLTNIENALGSHHADSILGSAEDNVLKGNRGDDVLSGLDGMDVLIGDEGADHLIGGAGEDNLDGGAGNDLLEGGSEKDTLSGGDGDDILLGGDGTGEDDQLIGGAGIDRLVGGTGNDILLGGDGDDNAASTVTAGAGTPMVQAGGLYGGAGDDTLDGGQGNDTLDGGAGNDQYLFGPNSGDDTVFTGGGEDSLIFSDITSDQLWFSEVPGANSGHYDLVITAIGLDTTVTVKDWRIGTSAGNPVRRIIAADKALAHADVAALVAAMATESSIVPSEWPQSPSESFTDALNLAWQDLDSYSDKVTINGTNGADIFDPDPAFIGGIRYDLFNGDDVVNAGDGDDILIGGAGSDVLNGGAGDDEFLQGGGTGYDIVDGGAGYDRLVATGNNAVFYLSSLTNIEEISAGGFSNVLLLSNQAFDLDLSQINVVGDVRFNTGGGNDTIIGTDGDDYLDGGSGNDTISGGLGNDNIRGGFSSDVLDGGEGIDIYDASNTWFDGTIDISADGNGTHVGGSHTDQLSNFENVIGSTGDDIIYGSNDNNVLDGHDGDDTINGNLGDDTISGGAGDDNLTGGLGNDKLFGGAGADVLVGNIGHDILVGGEGGDTLRGMFGNDTASYETAAAGVTISLDGSLTATGDAVGDGLYSIENLTGSDFDDVLTGDWAANLLTGGGGNDTLDGKDGDDTAIFSGNFADYTITTGTTTTVLDIRAGSPDGTDQLQNIEYIQFADVTVSLGLGINNPPVLGQPQMADQIWEDGVQATYTIPGSAFIDVNLDDKVMTFAAALADGNPLPDWLTFDDLSLEFIGTPPESAIGTVLEVEVTATEDGNSISDSFFLTITDAPGTDVTGSAMDETLAGTFRRESMRGLGGDDVLLGSPGADILDGDEGFDTADYAASLAGVTVDLAAGTGSGGDAEGDTLVDIENVTGSAFDDNITGTAGQNELSGGEGSDSLLGGGGADTLNGGAGADILDGGEQDDLVRGGEGADTLRGGLGNDTIKARANADGSIEDNVDGGDGIDEIHFNESAHATILNLSGDVISIEHAVGSDFDDQITGNDFANTLKGGLGNDILSGGRGNDTLFGGSGNDRLIGGAGADYLDGEYGINTVDYRASDAGVTINLGTNSAAGGDAEGDTLVNGTFANVDGSDHADNLTGSSDANVLNGFGGDDIFVASDGNDTFDGGEGSDTIVYSGNRSDYVIDDQAGTITDTNLANGDDGSDSYINVEFAEFADQTIELANAGNIAPAIGTGLNDLVYVDNADFDFVIPVTAFTDVDGDPVDPYDGLQFSAQLIGGNGLPLWLTFDDTNNTFSYDYSAEPAAIGTVISIRVTATDGIASVTDDFSITITEGPGDTVPGTEGDDILTGTFRSEAINALGGDDLIVGLAGADAIDGGSGLDIADYRDSGTGIIIALDGSAGTGGDAAGDTLANVEGIYGSAYADALTGSTSADTLDGREGDDVLTGGDGNDTLSGDSGNDSLFGGEGNDSLLGGAGADILNGGAGSDWASYKYAGLTPEAAVLVAGVTADLTGTVTNTGFAAGDTFIGIENLYGTAFADSLYGDAVSNALSGDAGNDVIFGRGGNDVITGGDGNDILDGGIGTDTISGGLGDDLIHAETVGEDDIDGGAGTDAVSFATAISALSIDLNNAAHQLTNIENIIGGQAGDTIVGNASVNSIDGGDGNDVIEGGAGGDTLTGGLGTDTLSYAGSGIGTTFQSGSIGASVVNGVTVAAAVDRTLNGVDVDIRDNMATGGDAGDGVLNDTISGFENLTGSAHADRLRGSDGESVVRGGAGNDVIYGGAGDDMLYGEDGDDFLFGQAGADHIYGGEGNDRLFGEGASDSLYGEAGDDLLEAGAAGDTLDGGTGDDILIGGQGQDFYKFGRNTGNDTVYNYDTDSSQDNIVFVDDISYQELWFNKSGKDLVVYVMGGTSVVTVKDWFVNAIAGDYAAADDFVVDYTIAGQNFVEAVEDMGTLLALMDNIAMPASYGDLTAEQQAIIENGWGNNQAPSLDAISNQVTTEDSPLTFTIRAVDDITPVTGIAMSAEILSGSDVIAVIDPNDFGTPDSNGYRSLLLTPLANAHGTATIRVTADDGGVSSTQDFTITVAAAADGVNLSVPVTVSGDADEAISIAGLAANLIDADGSEVIDSILIEGIPVGAKLTAGGNSFTASMGITSVDVVGWDLAALTVTPPAGSSAEFTLSVSSRSRELSNGDLSSYSTPVDIAINVNGRPTGVNLSYTSPLFNENVASVEVGTLSAIDPDDASGSYSYAVIGAETSRFYAIGNKLYLQTGVSLDYEAGDITVGIRVTDNTTGTALVRDGSVTVRPEDVDEAPSAPNQFGTSVNENALGKLLTFGGSVDPEGQAVSYQFAAGGNPGGLFSINALGELYLDTRLDFENRPAAFGNNDYVDVTVVATTASGVTSSETTSRITLLDVNEAPTTPTSINSDFEVNEGYDGIIDLQLSATDPDGDNVTYHIESGNFGGVFEISGTQLNVVGILDAEDRSSYELKIYAEDEHGVRSGLLTQDITVKNVNERPYNVVDTNGDPNVVTEGVAGEVDIELSAQDPENDALKYIIVGGDPHNWFSIDPDTNTVQVSDAVNFENSAVSDGTITLRIVAEDPSEERSDEAEFTIAVNNVNEQVSFDTGSVVVDLSETVGNLTRTIDAKWLLDINDGDADTDPFGRSGWEVEITQGDTTKFETSKIGNEWYLVALAGHSFDYEDISSYDFVLTVRDNKDDPANQTENTQNFRVNIQDIDEEPNAPSDINVSVNEGQTGVLFSVGGSNDPEGQPVVYDFASGGNTGALFAISSSGEVSLSDPATPFDFESLPLAFDENNQIDIEVVARDPAANESAPTTITLTVINLNDSAPNIPVVSEVGTTTFNENSGSGTVVATFDPPSDPDGSINSLSYQLANNPGNMFQISGNQLKVKPGHNFDYEQFASGGTSTSFNVLVRTTDGTHVSGNKSVSVTVNNLDDNLPTASISRAPDVPDKFLENVFNPLSTPNKLIATVNASDADGDTLSYSIVAGNPGNALYVNQGGELRLSAGFDYETLSGNTALGEGPDYAYSVTVRVAQAVGDGRHVDETLTLTIEDLDESVTIYGGNALPYTYVFNDVGISGADLGGGYYYKQSTFNVYEVGIHQTYMSIYLDANGNGYEDPADQILTQFSSPTVYQSRPTTYTHLQAGYQWTGTPWASNFVQQLPPIVFDLDGSGIRASDISVAFDIDGDGTKDQTGWISGGQGFLALDRDGDGFITHGAEISFIQDLPGARTDLEGLSAFDSNSDGIFDAQDVRFGEFLVWQDANENGESEAGELLSLTEAGIASIVLTGTPEQQSDEGNIGIVATSTFTRTDGTTGAVGDVALRWDRITDPDSNTGFSADTVFAIDADGNGIVDPASETLTLTEALSSFDSNGDGELTTTDDRYFDLKIWTDSNGNGRTEIIELYGLDEQVPTVAAAPEVPAPTNDTPVEPVSSEDGETDLDSVEQPGLLQQTGDITLQRRMLDGLSDSQLTMLRQAHGEDANLVALRAGLGGDQPGKASQGLSLDVPDGVDPFDYYAQADQNAVATADDMEEVTADIMSKEPLPNAYQGGPELVDGDALRIALMTQDMSAFGVTTASEALKKRQNATMPVDYFAA